MENNEACRLVILEIGCGQRVPCVRQESECVLDDLVKRLGLDESGDPCWYEEEECSIPRALLIRINPEYPYNQMNPHLTLPVQGSALASLTEIDDHVMALLQEHNMGSSAEVQ
uniref:Uncharacterized protein n=2 Tax=Hanusia phi TaxID=3032 RepID=A0A7S0I2F7_9CRYP